MVHATSCPVTRTASQWLPIASHIASHIDSSTWLQPTSDANAQVKLRLLVVVDSNEAGEAAAHRMKKVLKAARVTATVKAVSLESGFDEVCI